jgi:hypothetical protein
MSGERHVRVPSFSCIQQPPRNLTTGAYEFETVRGAFS